MTLENGTGITVKELIEKLEKANPDAEVVISGARVWNIADVSIRRGKRTVTIYV